MVEWERFSESSRGEPIVDGYILSVVLLTD